MAKIKLEKSLIVTVCAECKVHISTRTTWQKFCSPKCRNQHNYQMRRKQVSSQKENKCRDKGKEKNNV